MVSGVGIADMLRGLNEVVVVEAATPEQNVIVL